jgi:hypothetical protein
VVGHLVDPLPRAPAWVVVVGYLGLSEVSFLVLGDAFGSLTSVVISSLMLLLFIAFLIPRGRREGWGIVGIMMGVGFLVALAGQLFDLSHEVRQALWMPAASALTYVAFDRRRRRQVRAAADAVSQAP